MGLVHGQQRPIRSVDRPRAHLGGPRLHAQAVEVQRSAKGNVNGRGLVDMNATQIAEGLGHGQEDGGLDWVGLDLGERPDRGPTEVAEMGATAEGRPEICCKGANVSPRGASHRYVVGALLVAGCHVEAVHGHRSGISFHLTALPGDLVESPATDPDRRHHGWNLLDDANECPCCGHYLVRIHGRHVMDGGYLA